MNENKKYLSVAIVISSIILGLAFYLSRQTTSTVKVVGYAINSFESDIVQWQFNLSERTDLFDLKNGYKKLNTTVETLKKIIKEKNIELTELNFKPININDIYDRDGNVTGKRLSQEVILISKNIDQIENLSTDPIIFIENNILFEYSYVNYHNTNLEILKKELLGDAIKNAKERAEEILSAAGNKVGKLKNARSGIFQITEPLSTEVADYGIHSTSTRKKNIKVTVSAEFEIE